MKRFFSGFAERILDIRSAGWLLAGSTLWLLITAGMRPLMLPDEGRYVGVAWEMLSSGNWLVPTLDGMPFFHKPPLFYWLTAAGMQIFGANEWSGRLASTASAILATLALFAFVRKHADKSTANLAAVVLVTQPFYFAGAQFANLDMLVAAMISITILAVADAALCLERDQPYRGMLTVGYVFAALGVLAKGLIGFVLPGAVLFVWLAVRRKYRLLPKLLSLPHVLLFCALTAPWFLWMEKSFDGFWDYFFVYHHFRRFAETGFNNQQAFWFYLPVLLLFTLPWSPWVFRIASRAFLRDTEKSAIRSLMVIWVMIILAFFSLPKSKLVGYILPALPPFASLIADLAMTWRREQEERAALWIGCSLLGAVILCIGIVVGVSRMNPSGLRDFSAKAMQGFPSGEQIVMLDDYQYDMSFYLKATLHPWVVGDWDNPEIPKVDNWRKELYDAGQFDTASRRENLISAEEFMTRLCARPQTTFWLWGRTDRAARRTYLDKQAVVFSNAKQSLWRVDTETRRRLSLCGEKPSSG